MLKRHLLFILVSFSLLALTFSTLDTHPFYLPQNWPKPSYNFKGNPLDVEKFKLGRALFYDPILSRDSSISCSTCHLQYTAFTHVDHPTSHGIDGRIGKRNSPSLANLAWRNDFHWDGGVLNLNSQAINPITHHDEMDITLDEVLRRLDHSPIYAPAFEKTFGTQDIRPFHLVKALAQYTVALVSANAKYDQVMRKEEGVQFSEQELKGYNLFKQNCISCHSGPTLGGDLFRSNGLILDPELNDFGRMTITGKAKDSLLFRVPSLRNIEYSFPYMHDGRYKKLKDVMDHYAHLEDNQVLSKELKRKKLNLSSNDQKDLIAFLKTLSDKQFLFDDRFKYAPLK